MFRVSIIIVLFLILVDAVQTYRYTRTYHTCSEEAALLKKYNTVDTFTTFRYYISLSIHLIKCSLLKPASNTFEYIVVYPIEKLKKIIFKE